MSEIRRVAIKMKHEESIITACKNAGMEAVKNPERILVKNHGIRSYGDIRLIKQKDGNYLLEGDANEKDLKELANKLKGYYAEIMALKTVQAKGYNLVERKVENGKIKLKVRTYA